MAYGYNGKILRVDLTRGIPSRGKLQELGIDWVAEELRTRVNGCK